MIKKWYTSKTIWVNAIATIIAIYEAKTGQSIADPSIQLAILGTINFILRILTKDQITW